MAKRKVLSYSETCEAVFGESGLFTPYIFVPIYSKNRSIDDVSERMMKNE